MDSYRVSIGLLFTLAFAAGTASAQPPAPRPLGSPPPPPGLSPYLNLLRGGASAGVNYQGLVKPQLYFQGAIQNLQSQAAAANSPVSAPQSEGELPGTGIPVQFQNHLAYFQNAGTMIGGGAGQGQGAIGRPGGARQLGNQQPATPNPRPRTR